MLKNLLNKAKTALQSEQAQALKSHAQNLAQQGIQRAGDAIKAARDDNIGNSAPKAANLSKAEKDVAIKLLNNVYQKPKDATADEHKRGSALVDLSGENMQSKLREKTAKNQLTLGGVPLDLADEQQHILICGAPGTGKSVEIKKILRTIRARKQRALVYDPSGEFISMFYRPETDIILNPLDARSAKWNPWMDADSFEYPALANSFIPERGGESDPFWTASARTTFEALLMQCESTDEIVFKGITAPLEELKEIVENAGFGGMVGPLKTFQSTRSTLAVYLRSLGLLENIQKTDKSAFSFRKWTEDDQSDQWVFLPSPSRARTAITPLLSMWLDTAVRHIMSLNPNPERKIALELDELPSLQNIPSLSPALAEGRKFGISAILGVQTYPQLQKIYGKELAQALWGLPKTRLYLRIADADTSEIVSKELGEIQLKRKTQSTSDSKSYSSTSGKGGSSTDSESSSTSTNEQVSIERVVMPSEIAGLPDLFGYLRAGGSHRVAKVKVNFDGLPRSGEQETVVWKEQRQLPRTFNTSKIKDETVTPELNPDHEQSDNAEDLPDLPPDELSLIMNQEQKRAAKIGELSIKIANESLAEWTDESKSAIRDEDMDTLMQTFFERAELQFEIDELSGEAAQIAAERAKVADEKIKVASQIARLKAEKSGNGV